ncbi:DUF2510 domain-containing protein [Agrococcus jejuensis]|uniref:DUF2510 domain-containing protein n=1 Tax=Agrococcus jejuensis TaxID=399736 RepID=A0A1G8D922_9MICO|nr:DUF2510 domain-containing protein [Agrococcus jejuensis]SDH54205.1 Protein of unknown function [Agrococcus jejuensis]
MSSTTPAGWYPDPEREGATRWWDGTQWAPSQEPAASDDRFKPKDESDAGAAAGEAGAEPSWSPEPYAGPGTAWDGGSTAGTSDASWNPSPAAGSAEPSWNPTPASTPEPTASAPSWQQQETPSWQAQSSTPSYGAPQDFSQTGAQQWNSYATPPKKSRTGLFVGIGAGVLVLLLLLVGGGIWAVSSLIGGATQVQTQGGGSGGGGTGGGGGGGTQGVGTFTVTISANGQSYTDIEIPTSGRYVIDVIPTNGEDPRIELTGNGQSYEDDDGGDVTWASRLDENLSAGTYTLMVEEYSGDPLVAEVTITQY